MELNNYIKKIGFSHNTNKGRCLMELLLSSHMVIRLMIKLLKEWGFKELTNSQKLINSTHSYVAVYEMDGVLCGIERNCNGNVTWVFARDEFIQPYDEYEKDVLWTLTGYIDTDRGVVYKIDKGRIPLKEESLQEVFKTSLRLFWVYRKDDIEFSYYRYSNGGLKGGVYECRN